MLHFSNISGTPSRHPKTQKGRLYFNDIQQLNIGLFIDLFPLFPAYSAMIRSPNNTEYNRENSIDLQFVCIDTYI